MHPLPIDTTTALDSGWHRLVPSVYSVADTRCVHYVGETMSCAVVNGVTGDSLPVALRNIPDAEILMIHRHETSGEGSNHGTFYRLAVDVDGRPVVNVALMVCDESLRRKLVAFHKSSQLPVGYTWTDEECASMFLTVGRDEMERIKTRVVEFDAQNQILTLDMLPCVTFDAEALVVLAKLPIQFWIAVDTTETVSIAGKSYPIVKARGIPRTTVSCLIGSDKSGYTRQNVTINSEPYYPHDVVSIAHFGCRVALIPGTTERDVNSNIPIHIQSIYTNGNELCATSDNVIVGVHSDVAMSGQKYKLAITTTAELYRQYCHWFDPEYVEGLDCIDAYIARIAAVGSRLGGDNQHDDNGDIDIDIDTSHPGIDVYRTTTGPGLGLGKRPLSDMDDDETLANVREFKRRAEQVETDGVVSSLGSDRVMFRFKRR